MASVHMIQIWHPVYPCVHQLKLMGVWNRVLSLQWQLAMLEQNIHLADDTPTDTRTKDKYGVFIAAMKNWPSISTSDLMTINQLRMAIDTFRYSQSTIEDNPWIHAWWHYMCAFEIVGHNQYDLAQSYESVAGCIYRSAVLSMGYSNGYVNRLEHNDGEFIKIGRHQWVYNETYTKQLAILDNLVGDIGTWEVATEMVKESHGKQGMWGWKPITKKYPSGRLGLGSLNLDDARLVWDARQKLLPVTKS